MVETDLERMRTPQPLPNILDLSPELAERAREELNEDPKTRKDDIKALRKWLSKQPHLIAATDDENLVMMLRFMKFSLERAKQKIDMHYTLRAALPEFFKDRDPFKPEIQEVLKVGPIFPLMEFDPLGRPVIIGRLGSEDPSKIHPYDIARAVCGMGDVMMRVIPAASVIGAVGIIDLKGFTAAHLACYPPTMIKKMVKCGQDGFPVRGKYLHVINAPRIVEATIELIRSFVSPKIRNRFTVHRKGFETLYEYLPKDILPAEYGGTNGTLQDHIANAKKLMEDHRQLLIETSKYGCDESKRPGKPKTQQDLFGIEGSFRKLNVD